MDGKIVKYLYQVISGLFYDMKEGLSVTSFVGLSEGGCLQPSVEGGKANFCFPGSLGGGRTGDKALDGTILPEG